MNKKLADDIEYTISQLYVDISIMKTLIDLLRTEFENSYNSFDNNTIHLIMITQRLNNSIKQKHLHCQKDFLKLKLNCK